jgi:predicted O-methyltransferase YrrM
MWSNRWHELKSYLFFLRDARGPHGVHSPFVYQLITVVLRDKNRSSKFQLIEQERKQLRKSQDVIEVQDFGAGSRMNNGTMRSVADIARIALQPAKNAHAIALLAKHAGAVNILELGTSLGVTTAHLAAYLPYSSVYTIEGSSAIAEVAQNVWKRADLNSIDITTGSFANVLDFVLAKMQSVDFVIIDGDHRGEACLSYLDKIIPYTTERTVFILDDIYWSPSMTDAWNQCVSDERFSLTLDFFDFGVLYRSKGRVKEHFKLYRPWL